ncbi:uncharacterized protein B4U80_03309 [Leptotrombidium deliense]|uniref:SBF1/SBF2 domain-containing protein n=1 Tax=Leptotrombidium deliense TaxID=299467 RepID=A0A443SHF1_9ACAR|nr:uncharacterized protein B4U80_03309 [Leptotrombidium deliense]
MTSKEHSGDQEPAKGRLFVSTILTNFICFSKSNVKNEDRDQPSKCRKSKVLANKQRAVFGQPEVELSCSSLQKTKDRSVDSLDTLDSGHSQEGSSVSVNELRFLEAHDVLKPYRNAESSGVGSEQSTSLDSSETEDSMCEKESILRRNDSKESLKSSTSSFEDESQCNNQSGLIKAFMNNFVEKIFNESDEITVEEKALFGEYCRTAVGRLWFARFISKQRIYRKEVNESTFYSLVQFFAIVLFECSEADDFSPAKTIMNMCFTYYCRLGSSGTHYIYHYLREQPIWRSLRFWSAAFFDAVQCEKAKRPTLSRKQRSCLSDADIQEEIKFQQNITFGQLGFQPSRTFTYNMKEFGLSKSFCHQFLRKQCTIANLPSGLKNSNC